MVHAQKMQHAVEHQDGDLLFHRVPKLARLPGGALGRNGDLAQVSARLAAGEGKDVGCVVLTQKLEVQPPQFAVAGDQAGEAAARGDFFAQALGELAATPAGSSWTGRVDKAGVFPGTAW